jgi:hypothetical protein
MEIRLNTFNIGMTRTISYSMLKRSHKNNRWKIIALCFAMESSFFYENNGSMLKEELTSEYYQS